MSRRHGRGSPWRRRARDRRRPRVPPRGLLLFLVTGGCPMTQYRFADRMTRLTSSVVRDLLKVTERPDIISFAGGLPAPETFPLEVVATAHAEVFAEDGAAAMQYATTEGWRPLREWI